MVTPPSARDSPKDSGDNSAVLHPVELSDAELLAQSEIRKTKRSGPGGQHRNKVETAIVLTHLPTGQQVEASERRSQQENLQAAIARLRIKLAVRVRTPLVGDGPSQLWRSRCRNGKIVVSPTHINFPRLLAEALNYLASAGWDLKPAAERLGCTSSQLLKLIKDEPTAWILLQEERRQAGLRELK